MYKPTILLIDNDADLLGASKDYLEFKGYNVLTADNAQDAKRYCQQEVVHLAVIDVRLKDDNDDDDWSGLRLAAELDQAIPKIILTGQQYADPADLVSRVLAPDSRGEIMAADFVWKRQGPDELLTKIQTAFQKRIKLNTNLRILFTNGLNWQALVEQITIFRDKSDEDKRKAEQVLEDLIQRLFHQASTVHLLRATPGKDSCTVMLARPIYDGIQGAYLIVKIGPHKRIEQEIKNYETWVAPYAGFRITHLQKGPVISREIGAIAYAVVGREIVDNTSLAQCFFENAGFIVETTGNVLKVSKPSSPEWQKYGEIIIKCLGEQSASRRDVLSLENSLSEISNNGGIGFLAHSAGLAQEARRQIWRVRKKGNSIIPLSIPYMRQMVEANDHQGCYRHLVSLNRTWSILSDPYESLDAISDPQWFVGRENLKEQIIDQIVRGNDVVVYGMRKSGKTVLLNQVALACRAKGFPTTIWFAKRDTGFETVLYNFIDGLIVSARSLYPDARLPSGGTLQEYRENPTRLFKRDLETLWQSLEKYSGEIVRLVLLIDEMDINNFFPWYDDSEEDYQRYCNLFQILKEVTEGLGVHPLSLIIAAEYQWINEVDRFPHNDRFQNPMFGRFSSIPLAFLTEEETAEMVTLLGELAGLEYTAEGLQQIYYETCGHPQIIRRLCSCIWHLREKHNFRGRVKKEIIFEAIKFFLEEPMGGDYRNYFEQVFWWDPLSPDIRSDQQVLAELALRFRYPVADLFITLCGEKIKRELPISRKKAIEAIKRLKNLRIIEEQGEADKVYRLTIPLYWRWIRREKLELIEPTVEAIDATP